MAPLVKILMVNLNFPYRYCWMLNFCVSAIGQRLSDTFDDYVDHVYTKDQGFFIHVIKFILRDIFFSFATNHNFALFGHVVIKISGVCFITDPNRRNPTTDNPIPDCPARFLFFARLQNILMKFSRPGRPGDINFKPRYTLHWPDWTGNKIVLCLRLLLICQHFFRSLLDIGV